MKDRTSLSSEIHAAMSILSDSIYCSRYESETLQWRERERESDFHFAQVVSTSYIRYLIASKYPTDLKGTEVPNPQASRL